MKKSQLFCHHNFPAGFFLVVFCLAFHSTGLAAGSDIRIEPQKYMLENGLTVVTTRIPSSSSISLYALVKAGSATEGELLGSGLSHFMEHMLFKGTPTRGVGVISKEIQKLGGTINASTSFDFTVYTITVPRLGFERALDILADMLMNSIFHPVQIDKERQVVFNEMRLHKDNPRRYHSEIVFQTIYKKHPYRVPIIGYKDNLARLTRDNFVKYYKVHYVPNNIVLSLAGNFEGIDVKKLVEEKFGPYERGPVFLRNLPQEPFQTDPRRYEEAYPTDLTRLSLTYSGVSAVDKDMYPLDLLAMILGQGDGSRLHRELFKKRRIVRWISASNFTPLERGAFEVECVLDYPNVDQAVAAIKENLEDIRKHGVKKKELETAKRQTLSEYIFKQQSTGGVAFDTAWNEAFLGDPAYSRNYVKSVNAVTTDDIQRAAKKYFVDDQSSLVILKPKTPADGQNAEPEMTAVQERIDKIVLDSGMTVLLKEDHTFPIVSVQLALNGGSRFEPEGLDGISNLTAQSWVKGTKSRSAKKIVEDVEARGGSLAGFSGRNSFGIKMSFLAGDLDFGMGLLEDVVKNPVFDEDEFSKIKDQTRTAIIASNEDIGSISDETLNSLLFQTQAYRSDGQGTLESVEKVTTKEIREFYDKLVSSDNMVLSVFGDFDKTKLLGDLKNRFSDVRRIGYRDIKITEVPPGAPLEKTVHLNKEQAMVLVGFQGVSFYDPDRSAIEVMAAILGSPFSGRLFDTIRDQFGKTYSIGGEFSPAKDTGIIQFYALTDAGSVDAVKEQMLKMIDEFRDNGTDDQELTDIKTYLKGRFQMRLDSLEALGFVSTLEELYGLGYDYYDSYAQRIDAVTVDDIKRVADLHLKPEHKVVVVTRPEAPMLPSAESDSEESAMHDY